MRKSSPRTVEAYQRIGASHRYPSVDELVELADLFDCKVGEFFDEEVADLTFAEECLVKRYRNSAVFRELVECSMGYSDEKLRRMLEALEVYREG